MEVNRMDIGEFREFGFLQEANRQFFHPLGLALEVVVDDETGKESLGGIWDCRGDPEGIFYANVDQDDTDKADRVAELLREKAQHRREAFGYVIQPVPIRRQDEQ